MLHTASEVHAWSLGYAAKCARLRLTVSPPTMQPMGPHSTFEESGAVHGNRAGHFAASFQPDAWAGIHGRKQWNCGLFLFACWSCQQGGTGLHELGFELCWLFRLSIIHGFKLQNMVSESPGC